MEAENQRTNAEIARKLEVLHQADLHDETVELFCTAVNMAWGKLCQQNRASGQHQKMAYDQLAMGGFETRPELVGDFGAFERLRALARECDIPFGQWECKEGFGVDDLISFSDDEDGYMI